MAEKEGLDTPAIAVAGFAGTILVVVLIIFVQALAYRLQSADINLKDVEQVPHSLQVYRADQNERLNRPAWVNKEQGTARIPIVEAKKLVLTHYIQKAASPKNDDSTAQQNAKTTDTRQQAAQQRRMRIRQRLKQSSGTSEQGQNDATQRPIQRQQRQQLKNPALRKQQAGPSSTKPAPTPETQVQKPAAPKNAGNKEAAPE